MDYGYDEFVPRFHLLDWELLRRHGNGVRGADIPAGEIR